MEIIYGAKVTDRNDKVLGTIDHIIRDTWTGDIRKFMVRRKPPGKDILFSPQDVLEVTKSKIKVNVSFDELNKDG